MYSEINKKLEYNQQGIARLNKINLMIKQLEVEQEKLKLKVINLKNVVEKEDNDVYKIKNMSITSIFYSIIGKLDECIEKEEREFLAAKLKYMQAVKDFDEVTYQISQLSAELLQYENCQNEYEFLFEEKKKVLLKQCGKTAQMILELIKNISISKNCLKEILEAISIGQKVQESLKCVLVSLESAGGWGTLDLLGGGLISDLVKHSNIDDAEVEIENTQKLLRQFKTELTDIEIKGDIIIETDGFLKFADFFFDGIIADWFMQSKINESTQSVLEVESQVIRVMNKLYQMKSEAKSDIDQFEAELKSLIIKE